MKPLILVGGGGHCKSVIDVAESAGYEILGILDRPEEVGKKVLSAEVIGSDDDIINYVDKAEFVITVGFIKDPTLRNRLYDKVLESGGKFATIVSPTAYVSKYAVLGAGTVVMHKAFVNANVNVGNNVILNTMCNLEHDVCISDNCHISTGVMINGDCKVGANTFIGSQSVLKNGITIGDNVVVAAGSFVKDSIVNNGIYAGNPAKYIK